MRRWINIGQRAGAALYMMGATGGVAQAQSRLVVPSDVMCGTCRIAATKVATFGEDDRLPASGMAFRGMLLRTRAGALYYAPFHGKREDVGVYVLGPTGAFVRRIGRAGSGPGEFTAISSLAVGPGDSLFVFDRARRMSVFAPNGRFVRSALVPLGVEHAIVLADGQIVAMGSRNTPQDAGLPLHLLTPTGESVRSFGTENPLVGPQFGQAYRRSISSGPDGTVWVSAESRFEAQLWDTSGRRLRTVARQADWFLPREIRPVPPASPSRPHLVTETPLPWMGTTWFDDAGRLWVQALVAAPDWRQHGVVEGEGHPSTPETMSQLYDTIVEVVDVSRGEVLSSVRLPFHTWVGFIGENAVASTRELPSGVHVVDVWELSFHQ